MSENNDNNSNDNNDNGSNNDNGGNTNGSNNHRNDNDNGRGNDNENSDRNNAPRTITMSRRKELVKNLGTMFLIVVQEKTLKPARKHQKQ